MMINRAHIELTLDFNYWNGLNYS